jgi:lysophospholipid acyltransferase (LPLAT)-like uncharacterized protein
MTSQEEPAPPGTAAPAAGPAPAVRFAWLAGLLGSALGWYVRLVAATARISGPPISQDQVVYAIWHESNLVAATAAWRLRHDKRIVSFSTRGFRGIMMNALLRSVRMGAIMLPDEGKATRAEAGRLSLELARVARGGYTVVVSCDGPFGPYRVAKPGVLLVSREAGVPIQPWAVAIRPPVRLTGRWDRHLVPLPFCRMRVEEGERISVGPRQPLKPLLADLQAELQRIAGVADRRMERRRDG